MQQRDVLPRLRASLDSNDTFVSGGHGIIKTAGATRHAERMSRIPVWAMDDEKIKQLIQCRFPNARIDPSQRKSASRMAQIIHLYYRVGATRDAIAEELKMSPNAVMCAVFRINKAMSRPLKPAHRPRKGDSIGTASGTSGDDCHITL